MTLLSLLAIALILLLALYALGLYAATCTFLFTRRARIGAEVAPPATERASIDAPIAVLVPARNEGAMALRVIQSLLDQDTPAPVAIHLLLADRSDDSWPYLQAAFEVADRPDAATPDTPDTVDTVDTMHVHTAPPHGARGPRTIHVSFTGRDPKADKLNWALTRIDAPRVAVLDCDHQAHPDWLSRSVARLVATGRPMVQGRRHGLVADGLFSLWDSLHQHVGCELFNVAFGRHDLSVFLTGTTFVADTALLRRHPFRATITEDIDLSYTLFMEGERVVAEPVGASDEEVSPDLYSFLARRRRWAAGHTEAFGRHLRALRRAPIRWRDRLQFVFHGLHYLVAAAVLALHAAIGLLFAERLPGAALALAFGLGLASALALARTQRMRGWRTRASEVTMLTAWFFPGAIMLLNAAIAAITADPARLTLPLPDWAIALGLFAWLAPLALLLAGLFGFRQLTFTTLLAVVLTYPIAFCLDLAGVLLGLTDVLAGRAMWQAVGRRARIRLPLTRWRLRPRPAPPEASARAPAPTAQPLRPSDASRTPTGVSLTPVISIPESWRPRACLAFLRRTVAMARPQAPLLRPKNVVWLTLLATVVGLFIASRATRLEVAAAACRTLPHDGDPWIVRPERIPGYCTTPAPAEGTRWSRRRGTFESTRHDALTNPDAYWERLETTFACNLARFTPANLAPAEGGGTRVTLRAEATTGDGTKTPGARAYTSGALATRDEASAWHRYGRYEVTLQAARGSGLISAFFLHRRDPWQEIDLEILGQDTTHALLNVYFNPGAPGDPYNYGYAGTPVLVALGFDAAAAPHRYAIEWDTDELRWFADERLIHRRRAGRPTPIPHLPMRLHLNLWATCAEALAGPVDARALPATATFTDVVVQRRETSTLAAVWALFDGLFSSGPNGSEPEPDAWQDGAEWLPPHRPAP